MGGQQGKEQRHGDTLAPRSGRGAKYRTHKDIRAANIFTEHNGTYLNVI